MAKRKRGIFKTIWAILWRTLLLLVLVLLVFRFAPIPTTAFMLQSDYPVKQTWISMDELPPHMPLAVVASEDQRFPEHFGVDFAEISKALSQYDEGDGLRGASTISQQTAKNLFLWSGRSFVRKGLEAGLAIGLETLWGKKRILEVYLNVAEFGKEHLRCRSRQPTLFWSLRQQTHHEPSRTTCRAATQSTNSQP